MARRVAGATAALARHNSTEMVQQLTRLGRLGRLGSRVLPDLLILAWGTAGDYGGVRYALAERRTSLFGEARRLDRTLLLGVGAAGDDDVLATWELWSV